MTFDRLADRCLLFIEERKAMLISLLKEAELEISRKCNMYEDTRVYTADGSQSYGLPSNFKQILFLQHKGDRMHPVAEDEIAYETDGTISTGDPTGYFIRNNGFHFNYLPTSGTIKLSYYATVDGAQDPSADPSPVVPIAYHRDLCNYAIAIAAAKDNPGLHDKHWMLWNESIREIINQDADRELIHTIKREV